jgi:hypothetical protein
MTVLID